MSSSRFNNKTVLITGVAGFVGSHLAEAVMQEGGKVVGADNFITGQRQNIDILTRSFADHFIFTEADVSDYPDKYIPKDQHIDYILHFASPASPPRYQEHPVETYLVNAMGTHQLLSFIQAKQQRIPFLFASTSEVYGDPQVHPQSESYWGNVNPNGKRSCYDEAKRMGETICGVFQRDFQQDVRIVRIFNTYGPRMDLSDGRIIPSFVQSLLHDTPLTVFGDGSQTRSYCYVDDLVSGILALLLHPLGNGKTVNLGNPGEFTIMQTVKMFERVVGHSLQVEYLPLPADDPTRRQPVIQQAKELLQWEPKVDFEEGLRKTIEYFRAIVK